MQRLLENKRKNNFHDKSLRMHFQINDLSNKTSSIYIGSIKYNVFKSNITLDGVYISYGLCTMLVMDYFLGTCWTILVK